MTRERPKNKISYYDYDITGYRSIADKHVDGIRRLKWPTPKILLKYINELKQDEERVE